MTSRAVAVALCALAPALFGCGTSGRATASGLGMEVELVPGWTGRILLGSEGTPVLHAANFPLPSNDDDFGQVARQSIGGRGQVYVNVRALGPGVARSAPIELSAADFGPPPAGPGGRCCFVTLATRDVGSSGQVFRVTVVSGSDEPPAAAAIDEANAVLATLSLGAYEPRPTPPLDKGERVSARGVELTTAPGWVGRVSYGVVEARREDLTLKLVEQGGSDAPFVTARLPLQLVPSEFVALENVPATTGRSFVAAGRRFVLWASAESLPPRTQALAEANAMLATLRIEPGDFYPGQVEPATFAPAPGWHVGTSGPAEVEPSGQQTSSWASTIPYRDPPNQFPPHETLAALPPDGIVIVAWLARDPSRRSGLPVRRPPFDLRDAQRGPFEGASEERATYRIEAQASGGYDVRLWVLFGRGEPSERQLDRAQAEIERLQLPDWGSSP